MKTPRILIFVLMIFLGGIVKGQEADSTSISQKEADYLQSHLGLEKPIAIKVQQVYKAYKAALYKLEQTGSIKGEELRMRIEALQRRKNVALEQLLNKEQQFKFIPTTERPGQQDTSGVVPVTKAKPE